MAGFSPVAILVFRLLHGPDVRAYELPVLPYAELDIGRQRIQQFLGIADKSISSHHLRIRCNMFDEDDTSIQQAVFAERLTATRQIPIMTLEPEPRTAILSQHEPCRFLIDGDLIKLSHRVVVQFRQPHTSSSNALLPSTDPACLLVVSSSTDDYVLTDQVIGSGATACVVIAMRKRDQKQFACKTIYTPDVDVPGKDTLKSTKREISLLRQLDHPNIIRFEEAIHCEGRVHVLQELATGGDLFSYMSLRDVLSEGEAVLVVFQLTKAVEYLHALNIVHRDIKPENILMTSWRPGARLMLTDFGQAKAIGAPDEALRGRIDIRKARMTSLVGTLGWCAPEIRDMALRGDRSKHYGSAVDVWAIGCVTLSLFTKQMPDTMTEAFQLSQKLSRSAQQEACLPHKISSRAQSFIHECLGVDEHQRLTATAAAQHLWFSHPAYADDLVCAYERAISAWHPVHQQHRERTHHAQALHVKSTDTSTTTRPQRASQLDNLSDQ